MGFGARYADGCTSGHAISGLSTLQLSSVAAVIGFFVGGLTVTQFSASADSVMMQEQTLSKAEPLGPYLLLGVFLGIVFVKTEVISWFRIQEMFRFHSFHMYGVIGGAVAVGALSVFLMKRTNARTLTGRPIVFLLHRTVGQGPALDRRGPSSGWAGGLPVPARARSMR